MHQAKRRQALTRVLVHNLLFATLLGLSMILVAPVHGAETVLVPTGTTWSYLDDGTDQGTFWTSPAFDDNTWMSGPAQLGYGDGDEGTLISFGEDSANKHITTYFRHTFTVADASAFARADLRLLRDDGAVVYLNGNEIYRSNLPSGLVTASTLATTAIANSAESIFHNASVDPTLLLDGVNVLAVELHQVNVTSSDLSFDLELTASTSNVNVARGPYLQLGTPTSVIVRWRTDTGTDSVVRYGTDPANLDQFAEIPSNRRNHAVTLEGLLPDTKYYYSVGSSAQALAGGDGSTFFVTSPEEGMSKPTRVWILGDSGTADNNARAVRDAYEGFTGDRHTDLWLMLGDNAYNNGTDSEYQRAVFELYPEMLGQSVLWSTLGNHDGFSADSATQSGPYYDIFTLPTAGEAGGVASGTEAYYSFDYGNIHFICLDSYETDRSTGGAMLAWLENDLLATTADWVIAFWHHPPYSKGSHDSDTESRMVEMRVNALPILEAYGVDLVLSGHSHSYERSFLIDGHYDSSNTFDPALHLLDGGDGREGGDGAYAKDTLGMSAHEGAVYITSGSSGKISGGPLDHPAMAISLNDLGSVVLDVDGNVLDATFMRGDGTIGDTFTIVKGQSEAVCGNGIREIGEACDGLDLGEATCSIIGCSSGSPTCTASCTVDYSTCGSCASCNNNGLCEAGENCESCPNDCTLSSGASCGNGICEAGDGEDCLSCPSDCNGKQDGKPARRFCCGDGAGQNPVSCGDQRCVSFGFQCMGSANPASCCGDGLCTGLEDGFTCELDCGAPPFCGDGICDAFESACSCSADCGVAPALESSCTDQLDNDCDLAIDCEDSDCLFNPACQSTCQPVGNSCVLNEDCCSNKCRGKRDRKTCQ